MFLLKFFISAESDLAPCLKSLISVCLWHKTEFDEITCYRINSRELNESLVLKPLGQSLIMAVAPTLVDVMCHLFWRNCVAGSQLWQPLFCLAIWKACFYWWELRAHLSNVAGVVTRLLSATSGIFWIWYLLSSLTRL